VDTGQQQSWSYLVPFRRYGGLLVEKSPKSPVRTHPSFINRPRSNSGRTNRIFPKLECPCSPMVKNHDVIFLCSDTIPDRRTDGRTDRWTDGRSSLLWLYQRFRSLQFYRASKVNVLTIAKLQLYYYTITQGSSVELLYSLYSPVSGDMKRIHVKRSISIL